MASEEDSVRISRVTHSSSSPSNAQGLLNIDLSEIVDAMIRDRHVIIFLRNGKSIKLQRTSQALKVYWDVKLRNRRRAFGI
jgi:uncharacterized protein